MYAGRRKIVYGEEMSGMSYLDLVRGQDFQMLLQLVIKRTEIQKGQR